MLILIVVTRTLPATDRTSSLLAPDRAAVNQYLLLDMVLSVFMDSFSYDLLRFRMKQLDIEDGFEYTEYRSHCSFSPILVLLGIPSIGEKQWLFNIFFRNLYLYPTKVTHPEYN